jgi:hypothetical protein
MCSWGNDRVYVVYVIVLTFTPVNPERQEDDSDLSDPMLLQPHDHYERLLPRIVHDEIHPSLETMMIVGLWQRKMRQRHFRCSYAGPLVHASHD